MSKVFTLGTCSAGCDREADVINSLSDMKDVRSRKVLYCIRVRHPIPWLVHIYIESLPKIVFPDAVMHLMTLSEKTQTASRATFDDYGRSMKYQKLVITFSET